MAKDLRNFVQEYERHLRERQALGVPALPLSAEQTRLVCEALSDASLDQSLLKVHGQADSATSLRFLLAERVPPGVYPASKVKADFLAGIAAGTIASKHVDEVLAIKLLGGMVGGYNVAVLMDLIARGGTRSNLAAMALGKLFLVSPKEVGRVAELAKSKNAAARQVLMAWAEGQWFSFRTPVELEQRRIVIRTSGEVNTDLFSPAQEAFTRDDIPLHARSIFSASACDKDFIRRRDNLAQRNLPLLFCGDVVGTGSSRKSAANSLVWWIGDDIPHVPNKRQGGLVMAAKIAPIFFNTLRGCGAVPIRCATSELKEGQEVVVDLKEGQVRNGETGQVLSRFQVEPASVFLEARAGGRNYLIIGRKLTELATTACKKLDIAVAQSSIAPVEPSEHPKETHYSLAQKLVGAAAGRTGVLPKDYVEPKAHLVFSQDTTGKMTQQELLELAALRFAAPFIQSFCHTAAGPKSKDARMQSDLGAFVAELGGIDLRPGDGVIHTNGNRFLLPYFVGTGGDSHTRFPIGISFPAGSDLVAFAACQGYFPLDMPESVLVRFQGKPRAGVTVRDLVHAIAYAALKQGKLNLEKGDAKVNIFADRILEIEGLEHMSVEEAYKFTDASAERSAAAATFRLGLAPVKAYVANNLRYIKNNLRKRHPAKVLDTMIREMERWLKKPTLIERDDNPAYAEVLEIDLGLIDQPLLAAPNDPDQIVTLSEANGTRVDELFVGSCMTDISDFRAAAAILKGKRVQHHMKLWAVPPDRESHVALSREGVLADLEQAGANVHVPGCSLCMGNQAQVATGATVLSTSTRNFDNRMGVGAQVFLGSAQLAAVTAIVGEIPDLKTYRKYIAKLGPKAAAIRKPLRFS
jgi:aconitate hydratase 2/2-methylisocitrate dehydratase